MFLHLFLGTVGLADLIGLEAQLFNFKTPLSENFNMGVIESIIV